jgi:ketosteroid isomerase-like protein
MKTLVILSTLLLLAFFSCAPKADIQAEKAAVRAIVDSLKTAFETNNSDILARVFSHSPDNVFFGTDSAECWVGYEPFIDAQKSSYASIEQGSQITFRDVVVGINSGGDAAWVSYLIDWKGKSQGQPFAFTGLRVTAVFEKQNSKWSIVHTHGSVPVSGQAVKY